MFYRRQWRMIVAEFRSSALAERTGLELLEKIRETMDQVDV